MSSPFILKLPELGVVAHACIPNFSGGGDGEYQDLRPVQAKSKTPISTIQSCTWWHVSVISTT
jgi:hypothetical protein